jgi:hypothetical protein
MYKRSFIHEFREAVRDADIPPAHKLLLHHIATYANSEGGNAFPSQSSLATACGITERTVRRQVAHLVSTFWLEVTERGCSGMGRGGARRANVYQLSIGHDFKVHRGEAHPVDFKPDSAPEPVVDNVVELRVKPAIEPDTQMSGPIEDEDEDGWTSAY